MADSRRAFRLFSRPSSKYFLTLIYTLCAFSVSHTFFSIPLLLRLTKGETIETLLVHMKKPEDGLMDNSAPYVALTRATALEKLYLVEPVCLDDLQHKPSPDVTATLDYLNRLDAATVAAFLEDPSGFRPVSVRSTGSAHGFGGGAGRARPGGSTGGRRAPRVAFLPHNERSNCFHNAATASTLAAFDGQPLPSGSSCTPSAAVFFAEVGAVRDSMYSGCVLPAGVTVTKLYF